MIKLHRGYSIVLVRNVEGELVVEQKVKVEVTHHLTLLNRGSVRLL